MNTIVISGSAFLQNEMDKWVEYWEKIGYEVLYWPRPIPEDKYLVEWPLIHENFYRALEKTAIHFIANENKAGQQGYIGNGVFAEISFSAGSNFRRERKTKIMLLQEVSTVNRFHPDIELWMKMGWLELFNRIK